MRPASRIPLTKEQKQQIQKEYKVENGRAVNVIELAQRYGVSQQKIREVALGVKIG